MLKLNFNLRHQAITLLNPGTIVATDSKNYLVANFNFISDDWEYPLTAVFTSDVEKIPYTILVGQSEELEENECFIPWEVLQSSGNVYVSVFCGDLHTTNTVKFKVVKSGYTEGEIPPPPTPTIYEQILQALDSKQPMLTAGENITISDDNVISAEGGLSDYTDLENKPSINNVTLSGNKSSDDLSLQGKLTAGNNITINNGVISAEGGVTDYEDLSNIPIVTNGTGTDIPLKGKFRFTPFNVTYSKYYDAYLFELDRDNLFVSNTGQTTVDNFNDFGFNLSLNHGVIHCKYIGHSLPDFINPRYNLFTLYNFKSSGSSVFSQMLIWVDATTNEAKMAIRMGTNGVTNISQWKELTGGGAQIVSGVVNANGTITFTDSDGNTFTTTGSSVIGADGFSPVATVTQTASGATVSITDSTGTTTANISNGQDGNDYVLTPQDKSDIADIVLSELPTTQEVLYGNTNN